MQKPNRNCTRYGDLCYEYCMIHPTSYVAKSAEVDPSVEIGPHCFIGEHVKIARGSRLIAFVTIEASSSIGEDCLLHPFVSVYESCSIGNNSVIYPHSVVGSNGFGYATDQQGHHHFIPQIGTAILEDAVLFGPQAYLDRGALDKSRIGANSHIGALSHIAHNSEVGKNSYAYTDLIIAGSTKVGDGLRSEGTVKITGHITVSANAHFKPFTAVNNTEENPGYYQGFPHQPVEKFNQCLEAIVMLPEMRRQISKLKRIKE
jgi:UDP-3-O-[3-hydroxymyristoyl] glucosamine N-acyltransferase